MPGTRIRLTLLLTVLAMAAPPGQAAASTFCVPDFGPGCKDNGFNIRKTTVEAALQAKASDGIADAVVIQPGTYTDTDTIETSGTDHVNVIGAGARKTILTTSASGNIYVVNLGAGSRDVLMADLQIRIPAGFPDGLGSALQVSGDSTLADVDIVSRNEGSYGATGWADGGTYDGGVIRGEKGGSLTEGIRGQATSAGHTLEISGVTMRGVSNGVSVVDPDLAVTVENTRILGAMATGVSSSGGTITVENTLITTRQAGAFTPIPLVAHVFGSNSATLVARHVSVQSLTASSQPATSSRVFGGATGNSSLTVSSSILRGYAEGYRRIAPAASADGNANLTVRYSNNVAGGTSTGDGTLVNSNNLSMDPLFISPGKLIIGPGSPSIDTGDPASPTTEDILGNSRPFDGDGNASEVADQGAYEYDDVAPKTKIKSGPGSTGDGEAVFKLKSSDPASKFRCRLDHGKYRRCKTTKSYAGLHAGNHVFKAYAVDPFGNKDASPAISKFDVAG